MRNLFFLIGCGIFALGISSCKKEQNTYTVPTTYNFENVSYSGQTTRLDMLAEMTTYLKTAHVSNAPALDASKIKGMYANTGNHFTNNDLNLATTKQLKSKTYSSVQTNFETYMDSIATASNFTNQTASNGQAGIISTNDGASHYLLNANGMELTQIIEKGLMGACFYYQATAVYMGAGKMEVDNSTVTPGEGTDMEHHWDEAFGYFGVPNDFPSNTSGIRYWGKYCNVHEAVYPLNAKMMDNFLKGRAAISNKDMTGRDEAINNLRKNWELVVAATAIYYTNKGINELGTGGDLAKAYHALSEAYAFFMSLKYGAGTGSITAANVDTILADAFGSANPLEANMYNVTIQKLEDAKTALVSYITDLASVKDSL